MAALATHIRALAPLQIFIVSYELRLVAININYALNGTIRDLSLVNNIINILHLSCNYLIIEQLTVPLYNPYT